jgi:hypothetical protein
MFGEMPHHRVPSRTTRRPPCVAGGRREYVLRTLRRQPSRDSRSCPRREDRDRRGSGPSLDRSRRPQAVRISFWGSWCSPREWFTPPTGRSGGHRAQSGGRRASPTAAGITSIRTLPRPPLRGSRSCPRREAADHRASGPWRGRFRRPQAVRTSSWGSWVSPKESGIRRRPGGTVAPLPARGAQS